MAKLKKGDEVIMIAGKDRGRRGTVTRVIPDDRLIVENINLVKKHQRPNPQSGVAGGIVEKEMPIHISNVAIYNSATDKADRIGFKFLDDGRKVRIFKSNNQVIDT